MLAVRAQADRTKQIQELLGWHVHFVLNMASKTTISVSDLCPWLKKPTVWTPAMFGNDIEKMKAAIAAAQEEAELYG